MFSNNYDKTVGLTSLYIGIPFFIAPKTDKIMLALLLITSLLHWSNYENKFYKVADNTMATFTFCWYLMRCMMYPNSFIWVSLTYAFLSIFAFTNRYGYRDVAMNTKNIMCVMPHAVFRFFSFWFVMSTYGVPHDWKLTIVYWVSILILY